ncbi:heterokaryon incompatibility protein-domain-containing protein [Ustulina deusta]|nr:heterokaryon incompatibility protein-domain-containing protein [Ustulina deusta]
MSSGQVRKVARFGASEDDFATDPHDPFPGQGLESSYEYSGLSYPDSTRVFVLAASVDATAPIHGEIVEHRLSDEDAKQGYTALSYAWGNKKGTHVINIGDRQLRIGYNLNSALRNLRRRDYPIRLWVDALCINQHDLNERNHQVQQMRSIYSSALETIVYLGGEKGGNIERSAWNFLERHATWAMNEKRDADPGLPAEREAMIHFRGDLSDVESDVLTRPWFKRLWVFQEVVVSRTLSIQCGGRRISWDDFCKILLLSPRYHDRYGFSLELLDRVEIVRDMFQTRCSYQELHGMGHTSKHNTLNILDLLQRAKPLEASDPRDKIFGLLGIASGIDVNDQRFAIDYNEDCRSVYIRFTNSIIQATRSYNILGCLESGRFYQSFDFRSQLPSWVPNWQQDPWSNEPRIISSTLDGGFDMERSENGLSSKEFCNSDNPGEILIASGSMIGRIWQISGEIVLIREVEKLFQEVRDSAHPEKDKQDLIMEGWGEILRRQWSHEDLDIERYSEKGIVEHHLLARARKTASWTDDYSMPLVTVDKTSIVDGRRIAVYDDLGEPSTQEIAIVPAGARLGDYLVDLRGGRVPFAIEMLTEITSDEAEGTLDEAKRISDKAESMRNTGENSSADSDIEPFTCADTDSGVCRCKLIGESVVNRVIGDTSISRERVFQIY